MIAGLPSVLGTPADLALPAEVSVHAPAFDRSPRGDAALRSAIIKAAQYYLRLAQTRSPSDMEAMIWRNDGDNHDESCAAFASLTLESGARASGQQSWMTGETTYPWPVRSWVDSRVDPNLDSLSVISILQDAEANHRWHRLGDGYTPQPGDWVLFDGHVEVITKYAGGDLYTIGDDALANLSVNAHQYDSPLAAQGVTGFVNNGMLLSAVIQSAGGAATLSAVQGKVTQSSVPAVGGESKRGQADIPGLVIPAVSRGTAVGQARIPGVVIPGSSIGAPVRSSARAQQPKPARRVAQARAVTAAARIPGILPVTGTVPSYLSAGLSPRYSRSQVAPNIVATPGTAVQQAFIDRVAPGALAAQRQYGIPAAVTIAQAIDESRWGQSELAMQDNNLFGIKGTGPAGSVVRATQEYENGQPVAVTVWFRVYQNVTESIIDHCTLLATSGYYQKAIADRNSPDAFANDLTGVYATDPDYGTNLISLMRLYNLYRYDIFTPHAVPQGGGQSR